MSFAAVQPLPDPAATLAKALANAGKALGLTRAETARLVGKERTLFTRGLDPRSKAGELALLLIRLYRSLFVLMGGDHAAMRHWLHTGNDYFGAAPVRHITSIQGLVEVVEYLDALRGKS